MKTNGRYVELKPEKLRIYKGFENVTDEEAREQIEVIKVLASVLFEIYKTKNKNRKEDNT